jgi:hypothetical protein
LFFEKYVFLKISTFLKNTIISSEAAKILTTVSFWRVPVIIKGANTLKYGAG